MEIKYNRNNSTYIVDNVEFNQESMVRWVQSGGLAQTLLQDKVVLHSVHSLDTFQQHISLYSLSPLSRTILSAISTKPFILLAGISGTGKSRIVRRLAQATDNTQAYQNLETRWANHRPTNFSLIQVKPNWHNSMEVIGYLSSIGGKHYEMTEFVRFIAKAWMYPNTPFFLCLDEMNLAPVEEYFAEFLSAIESRSKYGDDYETDPIIPPFDGYGEEVSAEMIRQLLGDNNSNEKHTIEQHFRKKGLTIPENLIIMGTVNMDETTFSFSRKVLDRAMSVEMNEVDFDSYLRGQSDLIQSDLTESNTFLIHRTISGIEYAEESFSTIVKEQFNAINSLLNDTPFKLGYRAISEALVYVAAAQNFGISVEEALDEFILMKILPRIEGDSIKLGNYILVGSKAGRAFYNHLCGLSKIIFT